MRVKDIDIDPDAQQPVSLDNIANNTNNKNAPSTTSRARRPAAPPSSARLP